MVQTERGDGRLILPFTFTSALRPVPAQVLNRNHMFPRNVVCGNAECRG
jgi:hypothetical protein